MRKPHQRRQKEKEQERLKTCWTPEVKPRPEEGKQGDKDIFGEKNFRAGATGVFTCFRKKPTEEETPEISTTK